MVKKKNQKRKVASWLQKLLRASFRQLKWLTNYQVNRFLFFIFFYLSSFLYKYISTYLIHFIPEEGWGTHQNQNTHNPQNINKTISQHLKQFIG